MAADPTVRDYLFKVPPAQSFAAVASTLPGMAYFKQRAASFNKVLPQRKYVLTIRTQTTPFMTVLNMADAGKADVSPAPTGVAASGALLARATGGDASSSARAVPAATRTPPQRPADASTPLPRAGMNASARAFVPPSVAAAAAASERAPSAGPLATEAAASAPTLRDTGAAQARARAAPSQRRKADSGGDNGSGGGTIARDNETSPRIDGGGGASRGGSHRGAGRGKGRSAGGPVAGKERRAQQGAPLVKPTPGLGLQPDGSVAGAGRGASRRHGRGRGRGGRGGGGRGRV